MQNLSQFGNACRRWRSLMISAALLLVLCVSCNLVSSGTDLSGGVVHNEMHDSKVLRLKNFDLSREGADWLILDSKSIKSSYKQGGPETGYYEIQLKNTPHSGAKMLREIWSRHGTPVQANRNYLVSMLVKTDFPRTTMEIDPSLRFFDSKGDRTSSYQPHGLPAKSKGTDGWQRFEWVATVPDDPTIHEARFAIFMSWEHYEAEPLICLTDLSITELPPTPLSHPGRGKGVTFPGSVGNLPMRVESASASDGIVTVVTTGARFEFHTRKDLIRAYQRVEFRRELAEWKSSLPLRGLRIDRRDDTVCVLSNKRLTIGVQADSMMAISPADELEMTLENRLGGDFNRYARGHLYSADDFGGITVNPYCPVGSGRTPRSALLSEGLSFADFEDRDYDSTGSAQPGWQARWNVSPGELICTSVFPPRPYPWDESFRMGWKLMRRNAKVADYGKQIRYMDSWLMWDGIPRVWGHSYSDEYEPRDDAKTRAVVDLVHGNNQKVIMYMSAYWTPTRDADVYIAGVRNFTEKYNTDGVYSDGLPAIDWILAYKEMRMLRELFPDGIIGIHDSFTQSRLAISQFKPFLYTYATFNFMAEGTHTTKGEEWQYPRYLTSMFRKANNLGMTKGDGWSKPNGERMGEEDYVLLCTVYNGRNNLGLWYPRYYKILDQLKLLWEEKGHEPFFYDRYYLPKAQQLTGYRVGRVAMPIVERKRSADGVEITLLTLDPQAVIHYTTDGAAPTEQSTRYNGTLKLDATAAQHLRARAFAPDLDPSAITPAE